MNRRPYLSGPMTGHPDYNFPRFYEATERLRHVYWLDVINPAALGTDVEAWEENLRRDLAIIATDVDLIIVLEGWETSKGATLEVHVAEALGIPVVSIDDHESLAAYESYADYNNMPPTRYVVGEVAR